MKRADVIDNANIRAGDVVVGLASAGQATYETEYQVPLPLRSQEGGEREIPPLPRPKPRSGPRA